MFFAHSFFKAGSICVALLLFAQSSFATLHITIDNVSGIAGTQAVVAVKANDFTNMVTAQGSIQFDPAVATYSSIEVFGLPGMSIANFGTGNAASGFISFSWDDATFPNVNPNGTTLANGSVLFSIKFNLVGNAGEFTDVKLVNTPTALEFTDKNSAVVSYQLTNGSITLTPCQSYLDCDDSDLCTFDDCINSECSNPPVSCDDFLPCTIDGVCDPQTGVCSQAESTCADDGNPCTVEYCYYTGCESYTLSCDDGILCTDDACDPQTGQCASTPAPQLELNVQNPLCNAGTGTITPVTNGGTPFYEYFIPGYDPFFDFINVPAGTYEVTVVDLNGCVATQTTELFEPDPCDDGIACNGLETCDGNTGECLPGNLFACDDNDPCTSDDCDYDTGDCLPNVFNCNLSPSCCNDDNLCTDDFCNPDGTCSYTEFSVSLTLTDATCFCNGAIDLTTNGGNAPMMGYFWSNNLNTEDIADLCPGEYSVTVYDAFQCVATATITVNGPERLEAVFTGNSPICNGGEGSLSQNTTGGIPPYTYMVLEINGLPLDEPFQIEFSPNYITDAGDYLIEVTDDNGCSIQSSASIQNPAPVELQLYQTNPLCNGDPGFVTATVTNGAEPYHYFIYAGDRLEVYFDPAYSVSAGTHIFEVEDANGCIDADTIEIIEPEMLSLSLAPVHNICPGECNGSIDLTISGGNNAFYSISWSNNSFDEDVSELCAGIYSVTVYDANQCFATASVEITEPDSWQLQAEVANPTCYGLCDGFADISLTTGGTPPYTYSWSNEETTGRIENLCATGYTFTDQTGRLRNAADYHVVITDANGCTAESNFTLIEPLPLELELLEVQPKCHGSCDGAIDVIATGVQAHITLSWNNPVPVSSGELDVITYGNGIDEITYVAGPFCAGTYTINGVDANGCTASASLTISEPAPLLLDLNTTAPLCHGQNGTVSGGATGGTPPYHYYQIAPGDRIEVYFDPAYSIAPGTYTFEVEDASGSSDILGNPIPGCITTITIEVPDVPECAEDSDPCTNDYCDQLTGACNHDLPVCDADKFLNTVTCTCDCPAGSFSDANNGNVCTQCPPGFYQPLPGQSQCIPCPQGTYNDLTGQIECQPCLAGTSNPNIGAVQCAPCDAGYAQPDLGSAVCIRCEAGYFSDAAGSQQCTACPPGFYQPLPGGTQCIPCPQGTYNDLTGQIECQPCLAGTSNGVEGATQCAPCAAGFSQPNLGSATCVPCEAGFFSDAAGSQQCTACPPGFYQPQPGQSQCIPCPQGTFNALTGQVECYPCLAGTSNPNIGATQCSLCPAGSSQPNLGSADCTPCQAGYFSDAAGSQQCTACPPGYYQPQPGQSQCIPCPVNTYNPLTGQIECLPCTAGYRTDAEGATECRACAANEPCPCQQVADCDDNNVCTEDKCTLGFCERIPIANCCLTMSDCDDNDFCTLDECVQNECVRSPVPCYDGNDCTVDVCLPADGTCAYAFDCSRGLFCCEDNNLCTEDICDEGGLCLHNPIPGCCLSIADCDDGDVCTTSECVDFSCVVTPVVCDDQNPCTDDGCDPLTGNCVFTNNSAPCTDNDACTQGDICFDGNCITSVFRVCNDFNVCTDDGCDPLTGNCVFTKNSAPCTDNDACTQGDICFDGNCITSVFRVCNDFNVCTDDGCDPLTGNCVFTNNSAPCTDNDACTQGDICFDGNCITSVFRVCNDFNVCTDDGCDPLTGNCVFTNNSAPCTDNDACTQGDICFDGNCITSVFRVCNDFNVCTDDGCDPLTGNCVFTNNSAPCTDNDACTQGDICFDGNCITSVFTFCNDGNVCTDDFCDQLTGICATSFNCFLSTSCCIDNDPCTNDFCVTNNQGKPECINPAVICDDGNPCTNDVCNEFGQCSFTPVSCNDNNFCTIDVCYVNNFGEQDCVHQPRDCDDNNICTNDVCVNGCQNNPIPNCCHDDADCMDNIFCTLDKCTANECENVPVSGCCVYDEDCVDSDICTLDKCTANQCENVPISNCCESDIECTDNYICTLDKCTANVCENQPIDGCCLTDVQCTDNYFCTLDKCTANQCENVPISNCCVTAANCEDNNPCTFDKCTANECENNPIEGCCLTAADCDDENLCTTDECNPNHLCQHELAACDDGDICTNDNCFPASGCAHSFNCFLSTSCCDDENPCTVDFCDVISDNTPECFHTPVVCDDQNLCTTDACNDAGICKFTPVNCDDNDICTNDYCEQPTGICKHEGFKLGAVYEEPTCNGLCNGFAEAILTGGNPPYTYSWDNGETTPRIENLCAGVYACTVTDVNDCFAEYDFTLFEPELLQLQLTGTNPLCHGENGTVAVSATGGNEPYIFKGPDGAEFTGSLDLPAGTYTFKVIDDNGCTTTQTIEIIEPELLALSLDTTHALSCLCNGEIDLTVAGGTGAYTYAWENGDATEDRTALCPGSYLVTVTDENQCTATAKAEVIQVPSYSALVKVIGYCDGSSDIKLLISGFPPHVFYANGNPVTAAVDSIGRIFEENGHTVTEVRYAMTVPLGAIITWTDSVGCPGGSATISLPDYTCDDANLCTDDACVDRECVYAPIQNCCITETDCEDSNICTDDICTANECEYREIPNCCTTEADCDDSELCTDDYCVIEDNECHQAPLTVHVIRAYRPTCPGTCDGLINLYFTGVQSSALTLSWDYPVPGSVNLPAHDNAGVGVSGYFHEDLCIGTYTFTAVDGNGCSATVVIELADQAPCDDNNPCTLDLCEPTPTNTGSRGYCSYSPIPNCCITEADCDDEDGCTIDACIANECNHLPLCDEGETCLSIRFHDIFAEDYTTHGLPSTFTVYNSSGDVVYTVSDELELSASGLEWIHLPVSEYFCLPPGCYTFAFTGRNFADGSGIRYNIAENTGVPLSRLYVGELNPNWLTVYAFHIPSPGAAPQAVVYGCTNPDACNYDADANCDDGTCVVCEPEGTCMTIRLTPVTHDFVNPAGFTVYNSASEPVYSTRMPNTIGAETLFEHFCLPPGCYTFHINKSLSVSSVIYEINGSTEPPLRWTVGGGYPVIDYAFYIPTAGAEPVPVVRGCTNPDACNYDPDAVCDDGSCIFPPPSTNCCQNSAECDDRDLCTVNECVNNVCVTTPVDCNDDEVCTADKCLEGVCYNLEIPCDDFNECTRDFCDDVLVVIDEESDIVVSEGCDLHPEFTVSAVVAQESPLIYDIYLDLKVAHYEDDDWSVRCNYWSMEDPAGVGFSRQTYSQIPSGATFWNRWVEEGRWPGTYKFCRYECCTNEEGDDNREMYCVTFTLPDETSIESGCNYVPDCSLSPSCCDDGDACTVDECLPVMDEAGVVIRNVCSILPRCNDGDICTDDVCNIGDDGTVECMYPPVDCSDGDICTREFCNEAVVVIIEVSDPVVSEGDCGDLHPEFMVSAEVTQESPLRYDVILDLQVAHYESDVFGLCNEWTLVNLSGGFGYNFINYVPAGADFFSRKVLNLVSPGTWRVCRNECCTNDDGSVNEEEYCITFTLSEETGNEPGCHSIPDCSLNPTCCDDGNPCTVDECVPVVDAEGLTINSVCSYTPLACDDDDECTFDFCDDVCQHEVIDCDDDDACTDDFCDNGCLHTPVDCSDGNVCTFDYCNNGCKHTITNCNDFDDCTVDQCDGNGQCVHTPIDCNDNNPCTMDACFNGACKNTPISSSLSITTTPLPQFCQGNTVTLTAVAPSAISFAWSTGETSPSITATAGVNYTVTATFAAGCTHTATATASLTDLLSAYTVIATKEIVMERNRVFSGGIGATGSSGKVELKSASLVTAPGTFVKANNISITGSSIATVTMLAPVTVPLPAFEYNPNCNGGQNVNVGNNANVTLTGSIYKEIKVGKNSTVTFTQTNLFIRGIDAKENATLRFADCSRVHICKDLKLDKFGKINPDEKEVIIFVENDVDAKGHNTIVADIITLKDIKIDKGSAGNPNVMKGLFIAKKVDAKDYTNWYANPACNPQCSTIPPTSAKLSGDDAGDDAAQGLSSEEITPANEVELVAYPNPFSERLNIEFTLAEDSRVKLEVFNLAGQRVAELFEGNAQAGVLLKFEFAPDKLSEGMVIYRLQTEKGAFFGKAVMTR